MSADDPLGRELASMMRVSKSGLVLTSINLLSLRVIGLKASILTTSRPSEPESGFWTPATIPDQTDLRYRTGVRGVLMDRRVVLRPLPKNSSSKVRL